MNDWKTYVKAARNTAQRQAPHVKESVRRSVGEGAREARIYTRAASKVTQRQASAGREGAQRALHEARSNAHAARVVASRRYRDSRLGVRILRALRDASMMAMSVGILWFVFSQIVPIPVTAVLIVAGVLVILRLVWALIHNPYANADGEPEQPLMHTYETGSTRED